MSVPATHRDPLPSAQKFFASPFVRVALALIVAGTAWAAASAWMTREQSLRTPSPFGLPHGIKSSASAPTTNFPTFSASLTGVLTGDRPVALIRVGDQPEKAFAAGQDLVPGVRIGAIQRDRVVLQYAGISKTLFLANAATGKTMSANANAQRVNIIVDPDALNTDAGVDELARELQITPHQGGGYFVQSVETGSIYEKLGVRAGDVFHTLDAMRIVKLEEMARETPLADTQEVTLEVWRNGQATLLKYRFDTDSSSKMEIR